VIHRDLFAPTHTKHYSKLRIQFHLLISRYVCWDGEVPLTIQEMADELHCDRQSIYKFIKQGTREGLLLVQGDRLYFNKRVDDYTHGYIKHFPFLESNEFQELSLHAQRFVLYTLWFGVHSGRRLKRDLSALYHSTFDRSGVLNLYFRSPVYQVLEEVKPFLKLEIVVEGHREKVRVIGLQDPYAQQAALPNEGEAKRLDNLLKKRECDEFVSVYSREEILKMKKRYVNKFNAVGLELFSSALETLLSLHKLYRLDEKKEVGKYLQGILHDLEKKMLPLFKKRLKTYQNAAATLPHMLPSSSINGQEKQKVTKWLSFFEGLVHALTQVVSRLEDPPAPSQVEKPKWIPPSKEVLQSFPFYNWLEEDSPEGEPPLDFVLP
jgi:hypothetical protein